MIKNSVKYERIMFRHVHGHGVTVQPATTDAEKALAAQIEAVATSRSNWNKFFQKLHFVVNNTPSGKVVLTAWSRSHKETNLINAYAGRIMEMLRYIASQFIDVHGMSFCGVTIWTGNYGALRMIKGVTYKEVPVKGLQLTKLCPAA